MAKKFQNLTVSYKQLLSLSLTDRASMAKSEYGQSILSSLTPTQYASLFPTYYKERLPDISGFLAADRKAGVTRTGYEPSTTPSSGGSGASGGQTPPSTLTAGRATPSYMRRLKEASGGVDISDPKAKIQLSDEKKKVFDLLKEGKIGSDDPRVAFLKNISAEDLKKAGIDAIPDKDGKQTYQMAPTAASKMTDEEVDKNLRSETGGFSARERSTLDFISKREGAKDPNIIYGDTGGKAGTGQFSKKLKEMGYTKDLTDMSVDEVLKMQKDLIGITKGTLKHSPGKGTSAVGSGQMIGSTLESNLKALGIPREEWKNIKFDKTLQEKLTLQNFKSSGIGDPNADPSTWNQTALGKQYESLDSSKRYKGMTAAEADEIRKASADKSVLAEGAAITPEARAEYRRKLAEKEETERKEQLAISTLGKLPDNVDPKFAAEYEKMQPGQKQATLTAIEKTGVDKFNEIYQKNPEQTVQTAATGAAPAPAGNIRNTDYHQTTRDGYIQEKGFNTRSGNGEECATLSKAFNREAGAASGWKKRVYRDDSKIQPGVMVATLAYNDGSGGKRGQNYHTGIAVTAPDKDGNFKVLDQFKGGPAKIRTMNINTGWVSKSGYKKGEESSQIGVLKGAESPNIAALQAARAIAEKSGDKQTVAQMDQSISNYQTQIANNAASKNDFAQGNANEAKTVTGVDVVKDPEAQVGGEPPAPVETASAEVAQQQTAEATQAPREQPGAVSLFKVKESTTTVPVAEQKAAEAAQAPTAEVKPREQPSAVSLFKVPPPKESTTTTPVAEQKAAEVAAAPEDNSAYEAWRKGQKESTTTVPVSQQQTAEVAPPPKEASTTTPVADQQLAQSADEVIPVMSDGGKKELETTEITAYPIGPLKGDNSVVVDDSKKPLFTMNTNKETAHYDPIDKTVSVKPLDEKKDKLDKKAITGKAIPVLADGGEVELQASAQGEAVPKVDSSGLAAPEAPAADATPESGGAGNLGAAAQGMSRGSSGDTLASISETLKNMSANPITCPSFGRALAAANFKKSGDHYDGGATNVK